MEADMETKPEFITVQYSFVDGAHFFTSKDPLAKGLCVASRDLHAAFLEVPYQLKVLLDKNKGLHNVQFTSMTPFAILKEWADKEMADAQKSKHDDAFIPMPVAKMQWESRAA